MVTLPGNNLESLNCRPMTQERNTPPKTNMEPENDGFLVGISSSKGSFSGSMLVFGGVCASTPEEFAYTGRAQHS